MALRQTQPKGKPSSLPFPACNGSGVQGEDTHCCWVDGSPCQYLVENADGRRYACGLRINHGSWQAMERSDEYKEIGDYWVSKGLPFDYCQSYNPIFCCRQEENPGFTEFEAREAGLI